MTTSEMYDPRPTTGYRMDQLATAFDRVRDPHDWRGPIHAVIPVEDRLLVEQAVRWFTNTLPHFRTVPEAQDRLLVTSAGHRNGLPAPGMAGAPGEPVPDGPQP